MMKVVHIVTLLELGGAQQTALTLLRNLDRGRFEPVLFCGRGGFLDASAKESGVRVRFVPGLRRPIRPWWDVLALVCLIRYLREERPALVHTHSSKAGVLGRIAAWMAGVPAAVHTVHGFGFTPAQSPWGRALFVALERCLASITASLIFVSKSNREESLRRGIGRRTPRHLIRAAIPLQEFLPLAHSREALPGIGLHPSDMVVTTIGPFKPQKNLSDFIRAAALVSERHPRARFLVVGDGEGRAEMEKEIVKHGLHDRVILAGWRRDIPAVLNRTDIFCMTSLWEGLPMALVEAMAAGLPCVVNGVDGCSDVIEDGQNGFLTVPGHPEATAERILRLLADPLLAVQMGQRARESVGREFDSRSMVEAHERLYVSLLSQTSHESSRPSGNFG